MSDQLFSRNVTVNESDIIAIANALKTKMYHTTDVKPLDFPNLISSIGASTSGTINISDTNLTNVASYTSAVINDSNLITNNIKAGTTILGVSGKNSVVNAIGGDAIPIWIANTYTAYTDNVKITGTCDMHVTGTTLYIPTGWIEVQYNGLSYDTAGFADTELYAGQEITTL